MNVSSNCCASMFSVIGTDKSSIISSCVVVDSQLRQSVEAKVQPSKSSLKKSMPSSRILSNTVSAEVGDCSVGATPFTIDCVLALATTTEATLLALSELFRKSFDGESTRTLLLLSSFRFLPNQMPPDFFSAIGCGGDGTGLTICRST